jgi:hypothetical protein
VLIPIVYLALNFYGHKYDAITGEEIPSIFGCRIKQSFAFTSV